MYLLTIGAVSLSPEKPFTWASGLKSPIYCDNRRTLGHLTVRRRIAEGFARYIQDAALAPDVIAGTATAGIPHAAWLADRMTLPMAYIRSKPKAHGHGNQIEGYLKAGNRVVVVEDLISTGMSSMAAVRAVQAAGAEVSALVAIFSYGLPQAEEQFRDAGFPVFTLTTFATLLDVTRGKDRLNPLEIESLRQWQQDPQAWSDAQG